ncbi:MAG TPA: DUF3019 domain-containing protein [Gammaproteobacteria bacterium]
MLRVCDDCGAAVGWAFGAFLVAVAGFGAAAYAAEGRVALTVKPVLCITDRREDGCAISILVSWHSDDAGAYCLHSDVADGPLRCWALAASGMFVEERVLTETIRYWLTEGGSEVRLAEATLEVMTTDSDDRRRNRRRRHVWDIL